MTRMKVQIKHTERMVPNVDGEVKVKARPSKSTAPLGGRAALDR